MTDVAEEPMELIANRATPRYRTVEEMVVAAVREAILSGIYKPGEKLPQEQLAQSLGVSRIPVRAGLRQLESEGLVVFYPHRGAAVRRLEVSEIAEIYDLRILLESFALKSAISKISSDEVDELMLLAEQLDQPGDGDDWVELRQQFYRRLYAIAERPRTADMISRLRADVGRYWLGLRVVEHQRSEHRVIVDAVRDRDPNTAELWLAEHLTEVSTELQRRVAELYDQA